MPNRVFTISDGDSTTKLAFEHGFFSKTVWDHADNSDLKSKRENMNVLMPGDQLTIPERELKEEDCATEQKHSFKRKGVPEKLIIQIKDLYGEPLANKDYMLILDGKMTRGTLDGDGTFEEWIPPNAREGVVEVGEKGALAKVVLNLGSLNPIEDLTGVKMRLKNLGYYAGPVDGEESEELKGAAVRFREANGLEPADEIDDAFKNKLKEVHKS
jgi:hypothetical protein